MIYIILFETTLSAKNRIECTMPFPDFQQTERPIFTRLQFSSVQMFLRGVIQSQFFLQSDAADFQREKNFNIIVENVVQSALATLNALGKFFNRQLCLSANAFPSITKC